MAGALPNGDPLKQAVERAKDAFARLPNGDQIFQRCINSPFSIVEAVGEIQASQKRRKSVKVFEGLQKYTAWLQNLSPVVEVAVQTQAGVTCPVWAPLKFVLLVVRDNSRASEEIARLLKTLDGCVREIQLFGELGLDPMLQIPLLELFTDVVDFSVNALEYFGRRGFHEATLRRKNLKIECEKWLKPSALRDEHDRRLQSKAQGTCEWIQQNQTFLQWRDLQASTIPEKLLLISGTHGCGKSVLASAITEQFKNEGRRTLCFYFWSGDTNRQKSDQVARSFLAQLLRHDSGDQVSGAIAGLRNEEGQPSSLSLWRTLKSALQIEPIPPFCVLDGIDEASEQKEILANLSDLLEDVPNAKCLMLGRPQVFEPLPPLISERKWFLAMNSILTQQDIDTFINQELSKVGLIQGVGLQQAAFDTLQKNSSGMFLWVRLMISDLEKSCSKFELEERLKSVPQSLEDAYRLLFTRIDQRLDVREVRKTQVTLALIIAARRPLRTEELALPSDRFREEHIARL
ncbi:hypothetical protein SLS55_006143 [Diplodia seriata]|uniref:NACHT domain-containing protein n=1 Tax=Diplodia seriata TaxID=420778 RepID=A0ABR3CEI0_9PEZI